MCVKTILETVCTDLHVWPDIRDREIRGQSAASDLMSSSKTSSKSSCLLQVLKSTTTWTNENLHRHLISWCLLSKVFFFVLETHLLSSEKLTCPWQHEINPDCSPLQKHQRVEWQLVAVLDFINPVLSPHALWSELHVMMCPCGFQQSSRWRLDTKDLH